MKGVVLVMGNGRNDFIACLGCEERRVGCQSVCEKYKGAKEKHDERRRGMARQHYLDGIAAHYERDTARKLKAQKRLRGK